jgi:glucose/mannose-6-phosphate isomerase
MLDDSVLDAVDRLTAADRDGLLRTIATAGAQVRRSAQLADEAAVRSYVAGMRPRAVLACSDSAAEIAIRIFAALATRAEAVAPVVIQSTPTLPVWVGAADLLLLVGHVGSDERMLAVAEAAGRRGVPMLGIGPAPSPLEEACLRARAAYVPVPADRPARAALWGLLTPLLLAAGGIGLAQVDADDLAAAADLLDGISTNCRPTSETYLNPAKSLALEIGAALPVVWGTSPLAGAVAYRLAGQLAGNASLPALWGTLPVAAHVLGGVFDGRDAVDVEDIFRDRVEDEEPRRPRLVLLRDTEEEPAMQAHVEALRGVLDARGIPVTEITAEGTSPVSRLASLVGLVDFVTVYIGLAVGVDPSAPRTGQWAP